VTTSTLLAISASPVALKPEWLSLAIPALLFLILILVAGFSLTAIINNLVALNALRVAMNIDCL